MVKRLKSLWRLYEIYAGQNNEKQTLQIYNYCCIVFARSYRFSLKKKIIYNEDHLPQSFVKRSV